MYLLPQISIALRGAFTPSKKFGNAVIQISAPFHSEGRRFVVFAKRKRQNSNNIVSKLRFVFSFFLISTFFSE